MRILDLGGMDLKLYFLRKYLCLCALLAIFSLISGCCRILHNEKSAPYRVVTQIHVTYENGALETQRQISQEAKMRPILDYLRYLDPYGRPQEDPELVSGNDCCITLHYSDGSQRIYRQRADRYMRIDDGPWTRIDQAKAMELKMLLWVIPSDAAPVKEESVPSLIRPQI